MRKLVATLVMLCGTLAFATVCLAQAPEGAQGGRGGRGGGANRMDANGDGAISKDEWRGPEEAFKAADTNSDGIIDAVEMAAAREQMTQRRRDRVGNGDRFEAVPGAPQGQDDVEAASRDQVRRAGTAAQAMFSALDANRDGSVSKTELDEFAAKIMAADADKNGSVSREEATKAFSDQIGKFVCERFMKKFDTDKDGKVTEQEFGGAADRFKRLDANGDGVVTSDDFTLLVEQWGQRGPAGAPGQRDGGRRRNREGQDNEAPAPQPAPSAAAQPVQPAQQ